MKHFPVFINLQQQEVLIVGGGKVAARKARMLLSSGAYLTLLAPDLCAELAQLCADNNLVYVARNFMPVDIKNQRLVIAATDDALLNQQVFEVCEQRGILVNVVDNPALCRFIVPAIVDRSPLQIAISTGGQAPVLAKLIRAKIEAWLPHGYATFSKLAGELRATVKQRFGKDKRACRRFWENILDNSETERAIAGSEENLATYLQKQLAKSSLQNLKSGAVYLVGAGPGNPDLLTFRALRLMQKADVVLYDNLVSPEIMDLVRRDAERIFVGKKSSNHTLAQAEINKLLLTLAKQGKTVLRLKGGDPFIFGRGGEEIEQLAEHGINFEVVPGITAANAASCYAGIPLTHRDYAQSVSFVTGHGKNGEVKLDWSNLNSGTLVIYMGVKQAAYICQQLIKHGRAPETAVAIIEQTSSKKQRTLIASLVTLPAQIEKLQINPPALIIVGEVVKLADKLSWYK